MYANSSHVKSGEEPRKRGSQECYLPEGSGMENSGKGVCVGRH